MRTLTLDPLALAHSAIARRDVSASLDQARDVARLTSAYARKTVLLSYIRLKAEAYLNQN